MAELVEEHRGDYEAIDDEKELRAVEKLGGRYTQVPARDELRVKREEAGKDREHYRQMKEMPKNTSQRPYGSGGDEGLLGLEAEGQLLSFLCGLLGTQLNESKGGQLRCEKVVHILGADVTAGSRRDPGGDLGGRAVSIQAGGQQVEQRREF
jgi:hypothetical protein